MQPVFNFILFFAETPVKLIIFQSFHHCKKVTPHNDHSNHIRSFSPQWFQSCWNYLVFKNLLYWLFIYLVLFLTDYVWLPCTTSGEQCKQVNFSLEMCVTDTNKDYGDFMDDKYQ